MQCRYCKYSTLQQDLLFKHTRLHHWQPGRGSFPCLYPECIYSFKTTGALKTHLWRIHSKSNKPTVNATFCCELCEFKDVCSQAAFLRHLGRHLQSWGFLYLAGYFEDCSDFLFVQPTNPIFPNWQFSLQQLKTLFCKSEPKTITFFLFYFIFCNFCKFLKHN